MERIDALKLLTSEAADDRLRAARILAHNGQVEDVELLQATLATETNRWAKSALRKAILALTDGGQQTPIHIGVEDEEDRMIEEIHAAAVEETTQRLVHEIRPILGRLSLYASQEVQEFEKSKTWIEANRLEQLIAAIDSLSQAASAPAYTEFDLAALIDQIVKSESSKVRIKVEQAGPKPRVIKGARNLIGLIIGNAVRNAIEASDQVSADEPVVVNWDSTERDHWVAVLDRGPGLPVGSHRAFEIGSTTKKDHFGMGLALAKQAALSLNGTLDLAPRSPGGARFEFRWPQVSI